MKKMLYSLLLLALASSLYLALFNNTSQKKPSRENTIIVKLSPGIVSDEKLTHALKEINQNDLSKLLHKFGIASLSSVFRNRYGEQGRLIKKTLASGKQLLNGWFEMRLNEEFDAEDFVDQLRKQDGVIYASIEKPMPLKPAVAPNDSNYGSQWHLNNSNNPNFDIDAEEAWNINKGRSDIIVAVLDGGVDYTHSDLDPGDRTRVIAGIDTGDDDNDPMDDMPDTGDSYANHGTRIAGVIGARTDNSQQVAGVMWNCKIMPVKMVRNSGSIKIPHLIDLDFNETAMPSDVADALDYAVSNGAHVINLSYSFASEGWIEDEVVFQIQLLADAIDNAYQNNVVITASMGNEYNEDNTVRYPAGFSEQVIAVGATNQDGTRRSSSNTGSHIDLAAPGTNILTTSRGGGITTSSGTSFSAPIVAGVAGLIISQGKDRSFDLTNDDVRHIMELTATDRYEAGFDEQTGYGIVNANNALQLLDEPNVLYHYNSVGGTATMTENFSQWIILDNRWGISAGTYFDVDQYKVTKHITFDVPFCSTPEVWMRERESKCLSYANPNSGRPYSIISNITNTGFDVEYLTYYVRYNALGQTLNTWVPTTPASSNVAFTAVGEPNLAALATLTGPSFVCTSGATFTLNNAPAAATVTWAATPANLFSTTSPYNTSGTGTTAQLAAASSSTSGSGTITFTIASSCGSAVAIQKTIWVGKPGIPVIDPDNVMMDVPPKRFTVSIDPPSGQEITSYNWYLNNVTNSSHTGTAIFNRTSPYCGHTYFVEIEAVNTCYPSTRGNISVDEPSCSSSLTLAISPNPGSDEVNIEQVSSLEGSSSETAETTSANNQLEGDLMIMNQDGQLMYSEKAFKNSSKINVRNLKPGIYIVKYATASYVAEGKFIKQ